MCHGSLLKPFLNSCIAVLQTMSVLTAIKNVRKLAGVNLLEMD